MPVVTGQSISPHGLCPQRLTTSHPLEHPRVYCILNGYWWNRMGR